MRHKYSATFRDKYGNYIASGSVAVYLAGTSSAANIYTDVDSATHVHGVTTDSTGRYTFYVDRFDYNSDQTFKIVCSKSGYTSLTIDNITIEDACVQTYTISADTTVTTDVFAPVGCIYSVATGKVLTFSGNFDGSISQHFTGAGTVVFGQGTNKGVYAEWFGATGDGTTDDTAALQAALDASKGGVLLLLAKKYLISAALEFAVNTTYHVKGTGYWDCASTVLGSCIYQSGTGVHGLSLNNATSDLARQDLPVVLEDFTLLGTADAYNGIYIYHYHGVRCNRLWIQGFGYSGIHAERAYGNKYQNCIITWNGRYGIFLYVANNNVTIEKCIVTGNAREDGYSNICSNAITGVDSYNFGVNILGCDLSDAGGNPYTTVTTAYDLLLARTFSAVVKGCYFEDSVSGLIYTDGTAFGSDISNNIFMDGTVIFDTTTRFNCSHNSFYYNTKATGLSVAGSYVGRTVKDNYYYGGATETLENGVACLSGDGSPSGVLTPTYIGEQYYDYTNDDFYLATGTGNTNWKSITD